MTIFKIKFTDMKYGTSFKLSQAFPSEEKAMSYIEILDRAYEDWWQYDYEILEEKVAQ